MPVSIRYEAWKPMTTQVSHLVEDGQTASVSAESILEGLKGALFATSSDETKQVLTGMHVVAEPENLEFAATDGHRLAVVQSVDESGVDGSDHGCDSTR